MEAGFRPHGVFPALVTPFTKKHEVDEDAFRKLVQFVLPHVNGVVVCGTTGESVYLSLEERKKLYTLAVQCVEGKIPVIAGTGEASTPNTIELTCAAAEAGAAAALVVTPYFLHPSDKGIHKHFLEVARHGKLPIILYNIPQTVDAPLPRVVIEDLAEIENVIAVKDSSGNLPYTMELLEFVGDRLDILVGHDEIVLPALSGGCSGMILASAQVFPERWQEVFQAVKNNDLTKARATQREVQKLARIFCRYGGPVPVKSALNMMGVPVGPARSPLKIGGVLSNEDREEIRVELIKLGKLKSDPEEPSVEVKLEDRFQDIGIFAENLKAEKVFYGEGRCGTGREEVRIDVVAGLKNGPVAEAYCYQMTYPRHGYEALTAILEPNLTIRPSTLLVPAVEQKTLRQANMIFGPAQLAISQAIVQNVEKQVIPLSLVDDLVMLVKISIPPLARDRKLVHQNNHKAMDQAVKQAFGR